MTPPPDSCAASKDDAPLPKRVPLPVLVLLLLCSLLGLAATAAGVAEARARSAQATGQVLDSGETVTSDGPPVCRDATVTFPADEPRYRFTGLVQDQCPQDGGASTTAVYYDPDEPANAKTSTGSVSLTVLMVLAALGVLLCVVSLAARVLGAVRRGRSPAPSA